MKRVTSIVAVAISIIFSEPSSAFTLAEISCIDFSEDNRKIMYLRQNGTSFIDAMKMMDGNYENIKIQNLINLRVNDAYENYDQVAEDQRGITAHLFATEAMLACLATID